MAYADQPTMSTRKAVSIGLVIALHALIGYAFITGLAYNVVKSKLEELKVVDVNDQPPPPPQKPPPPPPEQKYEPPPIAAPVPVVQVQNLAPAPILAPPPPPQLAPPPPQPAPPPPPPPVVNKQAAAKGDPAQWFSQDDYPPGALREGREGSVKIAWQINEQGKVENCHVVQSSGSPDLDDTSCRLITRRGRYSPALDQGGSPMRSTGARTVTWRLPKD